MCRRVSIAVLVLLVLCGTAQGADWTWPDKVTIAGFTVTSVRGSVNADGSGIATGTLVISGAGNTPATITRSPGGDLAATCGVSIRVDGADVQGNGVLNSRGLRINGTIHGSVKPVCDAAMSVEPGGRFQGAGRISLNDLAVPVTFTLTGSGFSVRGSAPVESQCDTSLAVYKFSGSLSLDGSSGRLVLTAAGKVLRKGKLADQVTVHPVSGVPVNLNDGTGPADVAGVNLRFKFF